MIGNALKLGAIIAVAFVVGDRGGGWIAAKVNQGGHDGATTGIKIGTGVATGLVLGALLR